MAVKFMVAGDRLPVLELTVEAEDPDELGGVTTDTPVTLRMRRYGSDAYAIEDEAGTVSEVDGGVVTVTYQWEADDTLTPGDYRVEATVTVAGRAFTVPADAPGVIRFRPRL